MTIRKPLVINAGKIQQLQTGDSLGDVFKNVVCVFNGGGTALVAGLQAEVQFWDGGTIVGWTLLADVSGSAVVDVWKDTYANYPPVVGDTITAAALPTITTATNNQSTTLTGWTTAVVAGDIFKFNLNSNTTITRLTLILKVKLS